MKRKRDDAAAVAAVLERRIKEIDRALAEIAAQFREAQQWRDVLCRLLEPDDAPQEVSP